MSNLYSFCLAILTLLSMNARANVTYDVTESFYGGAYQFSFKMTFADDHGVLGPIDLLPSATVTDATFMANGFQWTLPPDLSVNLLVFDAPSNTLNYFEINGTATDPNNPSNGASGFSSSRVTISDGSPNPTNFYRDGLTVTQEGLVTTVPEPAGLALFGIGLLGLGAIRYRAKCPSAFNLRA